ASLDRRHLLSFPTRRSSDLFGPLNYLLGLIGIAPIGWLGSTAWAVPALILISLWYGVGGNRMVIFLAGLQSVPSELYEAAEVDGDRKSTRLNSSHGSISYAV